MLDNTQTIRSTAISLTKTWKSGDYGNSTRSRQNDRLLAYDIFKSIFLNGNLWIFIQISQKLAIVLDDNLAPNKRRIIIGTYGGFAYWYIYLSLFWSMCNNLLHSTQKGPRHSSRSTVEEHVSILMFSSIINIIYRKVSNIRRTKSQNLSVSRPVLQLSLPNLLKPCIKSRRKM